MAGSIRGRPQRHVVHARPINGVVHHRVEREATTGHQPSADWSTRSTIECHCGGAAWHVRGWTDSIVSGFSGWLLAGHIRIKVDPQHTMKDGLMKCGQFSQNESVISVSAPRPWPTTPTGLRPLRRERPTSRMRASCLLTGSRSSGTLPPSNRHQRLLHAG